MSNNNANLSHTLSGRFKTCIVDKDNNVIWEQPDWKKNLILNQGMDGLATIAYADVMTNAVAGTGTRLNSIDSGTSTGSVAGNTFTLTVVDISGLQSLTASAGGYTSAVSAGDMILFDNQAQVMVTAVSNLTASVTPSTSVSPQHFVVFKTSQAGLQTLHQHGNSSGYTQFLGNQDGTYAGTTIVGNIQKNRRTWDLAYETASIIFTEVGVGWGTANNQVFSRVLLPQTQSIQANQKLRLLYELDIAVFPTASSPGIPFTASISGWPVAPSTDCGGFYNLQFPPLIGGWVSIVGTNGGTDNRGGDPGGGNGIAFFISNSSASLANYNSNRNNTGTAWASQPAVGEAYVPLSFTKYYDATFDVATMNRNDIRSMGCGTGYNNAVGQWPVFACVFNQPQTKTSIQTLSLTFVWNWGRTLA